MNAQVFTGAMPSRPHIVNITVGPRSRRTNVSGSCTLRRVNFPDTSVHQHSFSMIRCGQVWEKCQTKRPGHEDSEADQMYELETERMLAPPGLRKQRSVLEQRRPLSGVR